MAQLLEASAGTGKTFRIAHAVLGLVSTAGRFAHRADGVPIDAMVVLTFTKAATAELRERIRRRLRDALTGLEAAQAGASYSPPDSTLAEWLDATPPAEREDKARRLRRALRDFDLAGIATLHSLCQQLLRRNALRSGWLLDATVEAELPDLVDDLAMDFWTRLVHDADPSVLPALESAGVTLGALRGLAKKASDPELAIVPPLASLGDPPDRLPDLSAWVMAKETLRDAWAADAVIAALADPAITVHARNASRGVHHSLPPGRVRAVANSVRSALSGARPSPADSLPDAFVALGPEAIQRATWPGQTPPTCAPLDALAEFLAAHAVVHGRVGAVIHGARHRLVAAVRTQMVSRARDRSRRSYHDLLVDLRDALRRTGGRSGPLSQAIRAQFQVALIDEFQDTDPVQWEIFHTLFADRRMLLVGDPKQAIYGFRGADVFTYERAKKAPQVKQHPPMDRSFRADPELHHAVYGLFGRQDPFGLNGPNLPPVLPARTERRLVDDDRPPLQLRYLPSATARKTARWSELLIAGGWLNECMPALVASDVARELARRGRLRADDGTDREVTASDCAVLVRTNWQAAQVQSALRVLGIPGVIKSRASVLTTEAAHAVTALLAATLEPSNGAAVRQALASRLMGRTAEQLAALGDDPDALAAEVSPFHGWGRTWQDQGVAPMLRQMLDEDDVLVRVLRQATGQRFVTDLLHLAELLPVVATTRGLGPAGLLRWLKDGGPGSDDDATRVRLEDDADAVRIITLHSAKGLEWGLVWCPYLWGGVYLSGDAKRHLVFHDDQNDHRRTLDLGSPDRDRHLRRVLDEQLAEELRIIYVALTRARHRCVVYWGPSADTSALAYLLFPALRLESFRPYTAKGTVRRPDPALLGDLAQLASTVPGIDLRPVRWTHDLSGGSWTPTASGSPRLASRTLTRTQAPDRWWRRSSYSALARNRGHAVVEHGALVGLPAGMDGPVPLADVPGGATFGSALHSVFEHHDFAAPLELPTLVETHLTAWGIAGDHTLIAGAMQDAIATPLLPDGTRLQDVPRDRRIDELSFTIPLRGGFSPDGLLTAAGLADCWRGEPNVPDGWLDAVAGLGFDPLRGFLVGAIDLIFEHDERWYVADYKSNHLGRTFADYAAAHLPGHMVGSAYLLQAHIYVLALHRFLARRLPDYDYDTHIGGALYLFLRGMSPRFGARCGVWADRPSRALIERLEALFCGDTP